MIDYPAPRRCPACHEGWLLPKETHLLCPKCGQVVRPRASVSDAAQDPDLTPMPPQDLRPIDGDVY